MEGKVSIDKEACIGCGLCVNVCPESFELNDDGIAVVISQEAGDCDFEEVANQCPVQAIIVEE